ncbi:uncharacterized protein LOC143034063 isoform X2 [Oratosquilla oratoria]|uniref:uncharacterized protein LOC143034063 isoform X2 n=1 Tax=Oratosquilla oratoria TaxID=337810 RepID=UPI003F75FE2A
MESLTSVAKRAGYLFYVVDRNTTTFETVEEIPSYVDQVIPVFLTLIVLEYLINWAMGKPVLRINDGLTSCGHGLVMETTKGELLLERPPGPPLLRRLQPHYGPPPVSLPEVLQLRFLSPSGPPRGSSARHPGTLAVQPPLPVLDTHRSRQDPRAP